VTTFAPGETCVWSVSDATVREVLLKEGERELLRDTVQQGQSRFRLPDRPGQYALFYAGTSQAGRNEPVRLLDVNPPPAESRLEYARDVPVVATWMRETSGAPTDSLPSRLAQLALTRPEILRQNLWWWLVLAALIALGVETAWVTSKRIAA
jgi:hypothetical protein